MKKMSDKRSDFQETTPILQKIERHHLLLGCSSNSIPSTWQWQEMAVRSNPQSSDTESATGTSGFSDGSSETSLGRLVIRDSDLASSWIYNSRKAAANEAFEASSEDSTSPGLDKSAADIESRVFTPVPFAQRERTKSSCCCYLCAMLIIFICSLGILSSIGGIVYMEVFRLQEKQDSSVELPGTHSSENFPSMMPNDSLSTSDFSVWRKGKLDESSTFSSELETEEKTLDKADSEYFDYHSEEIFGKVLETNSSNEILTKRVGDSWIRTDTVLMFNASSTNSPAVRQANDTNEMSECFEKDGLRENCSFRQDIDSHIAETTQKNAISELGNVTEDNFQETIRQQSTEESVNLLPSSNDLRESIAKALKRLQTLDPAIHPSSRVQERKKNADFKTELKDDEKALYLSRLRILLFDHTH